MALILLVGGCSQSGQSASSTSSSSPTAEATNAIDFPLYTGSTVITARDWHGNAGSTAVSGREVIAESSATLSQLEGWLRDVSANPPQGYAVTASGSSVDTAHRHAQALGLDFQVFSHQENGHNRELVVVVLDPTTFEEKAGPVLSLIDKYSMLPQSFRDPIDAQAKARTGFTVSQALDPSQPIGAAILAARTLRNANQRGVVLVDAVKK